MTIAPAPSAGLLHDLDTREGCISAATSAIKDYRNTMLLVVESWMTQEFGTLKELADAIGKSQRRMQEYQTELRKAGRLPPSPFGRKTGSTRKTASSVENEEPIDVEVEVIEDLSKDDIKAKLNQPPSNPYAPKTNVRRFTDLPGSDGPAGGDDTLAQHWQHVQDSDEPDTYKRAQYLLSEFDLLLRRGHREGWSEGAFAALRDDLESYARSCAACSNNRRERGHAEAAEQWASFKGAVQRGESGSGSPCLSGN